MLVIQESDFLTLKQFVNKCKASGVAYASATDFNNRETRS